MNTGGIILRTTISLAAFCYCVSIVLKAFENDGTSNRWQSLFWSLGAGFNLLHLTLTMQLVHGWSHEAAYEELSLRTQDLFHHPMGWVVHLNYVFTAVWILDALWQVVLPKRYPENSQVIAGVHLLVAITWIANMIVFGEGWVRVVGLMIVITPWILQLVGALKSRPSGIDKLKKVA